MDLASGDGIPLGANQGTATRPTTEAVTVCNRAQPDDFRQNPGTGAKVCDAEGQPPTRPVYQPDLPSSQEGRIAATSRNPETAEPFDGKAQIQNGQCENTEGPGQEE